MEKIFLLSLGCPKNLVDSENILALLGEKQYIITDSPDEADIIIVNTCAFLKAAVRESKTAIKEFTDKKKYKAAKVIVCGCLVQRFGEKLFDMHGIDAIAGAGSPQKVVEAVEKAGKNSRVACFTPVPDTKDINAPRMLSTYPYAYIKISEGCNNLCSYCLIPKLRGRLRSRNEDDIFEEAESLFGMGIKELILIAQDTAGYGSDSGRKNGLEKLLDRLAKISFPWIRLMYAHPAHINEGLLQVISENRNICRYLDIPLQHIHPEILKKMNRPLIDYGKLVDTIRKSVPDIRLRTTFIVGFPGETDGHFKRLLEFVRAKQFDRLGVFRYSKEKGTDAYAMSEHVREEIKLEREKLVMEEQKKISEKALSKLAGKEIEALVEGMERNFYAGRTQFDAPEIDGKIYFKKGTKTYNAGDFCRLRIISSDEHDLFAVPACNVI
ncbi:MAG TPA: 30S ribosomal protein S12 methylthiotransferase RimO [bacterium]|nr:30S ribosomal protein S12 methylthiotransferase RimO [bacterium]